MAEIRGCDLVVEYLIKEKVPYLFGYAGHGAVGLLDGVYNHQDEIKIIFPRIESAAGYMADAYFRASGQVIPVYTSTGPGPDAADGRDGERVLRLVRVHRDHGPGGDEPVRLGRAAGGVPPPPGRLPLDRQGDLEAELRRRSPSRTWASSCPRRSSSRAPAGPGPVHIDVPVRPLDPHRRHRGARARGALADAELAHARLARGGRQGVRDADEGAAAADPRGRRRDRLRRDRAAARVRRARERARLLDVHGQGRPVREGPALPRHRRLLGRVPGPGGGAQRRRDPRDRLPLLRHPLLLVGARLHVQHPADEADPRRHRPDRDRPQLPDRARHRRRRPRGAEAARRAGADASRSASGRPGTTTSRRGSSSGRTTSSRRWRRTRRRSTRGA